MKKFLAAIAMIGCLSGAVHAEEENWVFVADTADQGRVLIDANHIARAPGTFSLGMFGKPKKPKYVIVAQARFVDQPEIPNNVRFFLKIDEESCLKYRHGDLWFTAVDEHGKSDENHEYWDPKGDKTFDGLANWMCDFARATELKIDENGNPITPPTPTLPQQ